MREIRMLRVMLRELKQGFGMVLYRNVARELTYSFIPCVGRIAAPYSCLVANDLTTDGVSGRLNATLTRLRRNYAAKHRQVNATR